MIRIHAGGPPLAHLTNDTGRPLRSALHIRHKDVAY